MELTKEEAIKRHRMMWNYISETSLKEKRCVSKEEAFDHFGWDCGEAMFGCWCCEYAYFLKSKLTDVAYVCDLCPVQWPTHNRCNGSDDTLDDELGLYSKWWHALLTNCWPAAGKFAKQIANLPEKGEN